MVIIRHPNGEPWLVDGTGDLVTRLGENNYLVSETEADWGPEGIGNRTGILNLPEWFCSPDSPLILDELFGLRNPRLKQWALSARSGWRKPGHPAGAGFF